MKQLAADRFFRDQRVLQAKELILSCLKERQKELDGIRPPDKQLSLSYEEMIRSFSDMRAGELFYPYIGSGLGRGALVELADGSVKYDFISGIGVHFLGHSHPDLIEACLDAALSDTVMEGNLQQNREAFTLTKLLLDLSGMEHCFLSSTGVMANENGLKLAFHRNRPANRLLAFEGCFFGRTVAAAHITDKAAYREGIPTSVLVDYLPFYDPERPAESTERAVRALKRLIERYPGGHAVMCFELVQGENGFRVGSSGFFKALMAILREKRIAILIDEVQTFGRTHELFAFGHFGLEEYADIVTVGKLSQACATLFRSEYAPQAKILSQTFTAASSAIRASVALLRRLKEGDCFGPEGKNARLHKLFAERLGQLASSYPAWVEGPFGIGAMIAFTPFGGEAKLASLLAKELFDRGVISFIAGSKVSRIRFLIPSPVLREEEVEEAMKLLEEALLKVGNTL